VGKGLKWPVSGSGSDITLGGKRLRRGLLCDLCSFLCSFYIFSVSANGLFAGGIAAYPVSFEALLSAKVALFAYFLAGWTLESVGIV
jgi:hypothetical protein